MKRSIFLFFLVFFHPCLALLLADEGQIIGQEYDPTNKAPSRAELGLAFDGTNYWVTSSNSAMLNSVRLYTLTNRNGVLQLRDIKSLTNHYYISLTYDKASKTIIACTSNRVVRLIGSTPSAVEESTLDFFNTLPGKNAKAIAMGTNNQLWLACQDNQLYQLKLLDSFSAHSPVPSGLSLFGAVDIRGLAYDGYFLWVFDNNGGLHKKDVVHLTELAFYNLMAYPNFVYGKGDMCFNGTNLVINGISFGTQANLNIVNKAPHPVQNLSAADMGTDGKVHLSWNPSPDPKLMDYVVKWDTVQAGTYSQSNIILTTATTVSNLINYQQYYFTVAARDLSGTYMDNNQLTSYYFATATPTRNSISVTRKVQAAGGAGYSNSINSAYQAALPGDIISIEDNSEYGEFFTVTKNHLTFQAPDGFSPTIKSTTLSTLFDLQADNITLRNLRLFMQLPSTSPVVRVASQDVLIENCRIVANPASYTNAGIEVDIGSDNLQIINCEIASNLFYGIYLASSGSNKILRNRIHDCHHGIYGNINQTSDKVNICQNEIWNMQGTGVHVQNGTLSLIYNLVHHCSGGGVSLMSILSPLTIGNNTIAMNNLMGLEAWFLSSVPHSFVNNIIYGQSPDIYLNGNAMQPGINMYNNCYSSLTTNNFNSFAPFTFNNNIRSSPKFINTTEGDFHPAQDSPCINAGATFDYSSFGVFVQPIGQRDIGYYETTQFPLTNFIAPDQGHLQLSANYLTPGKETTIQLYNLQNLGDRYVLIRAVIYNLRGAVIKKLFEGNVPATDHLILKWDGRDKDNKYAGAGVYFLKIQMNEITRTEKIFFVP